MVFINRLECKNTKAKSFNIVSDKDNYIPVKKEFKQLSNRDINVYKKATRVNKSGLSQKPRKDRCSNNYP